MYLPSIGRNTDSEGLGILYLCIRLTGSLITNTKMYLPSIGRITDRVGLGILYLCIRLTGSLILTINRQ